MFRNNKPRQIDFDEIITEKDIVNGNVILIFGRPATGKTETCYKICEKCAENYNALYFSLDGNDLSYWNKKGDEKGIINEFKTSVEIVKIIENAIKTDSVKFVVIDGWKLLEDKDEWLRQKIIDFAILNKIIFFITVNIPRPVCKNFSIPSYKQLKRIDERLNDLAFKEIVVSGNNDGLDKSYYKYNDIFN